MLRIIGLVIGLSLITINASATQDSQIIKTIEKTIGQPACSTEQTGYMSKTGHFTGIHIQNYHVLKGLQDEIVVVGMVYSYYESVGTGESAFVYYKYNDKENGKDVFRREVLIYNPDNINSAISWLMNIRDKKIGNQKFYGPKDALSIDNMKKISEQLEAVKFWLGMTAKERIEFIQKIRAKKAEKVI